MTLLWLYLITFVVFLGIDYFGLSYIVKPVFEAAIPDLLREDLRIGPAFAFYAFYIFGVIWFVSGPALSHGHGLLWVFGTAALLGALAYGTYEFTNLATLKGWSWQMVAVDLSWGMVLTGLSATIGVAAIRAIS